MPEILEISASDINIDLLVIFLSVDNQCLTKLLKTKFC